MKTVIVKSRLTSRTKLEQKLYDADMQLSEVFYLHDRVYWPRNYRPNANFPRLVMRTTLTEVGATPRYELILRRHIADSGVDVRHAVVTDSYTELIQIIHQLGFEKRAEVSRRRQSLKMAEGLELLVDQVEGLDGFFAKMEAALGENDSPAAVREDLRQTLEILGQTEVIKEPYAELLNTTSAATVLEKMTAAAADDGAQTGVVA